MLELSEGQIIGVNYGSNDDPYVLVGRISCISSSQHDPIWFQYADSDGQTVGYVKRNEVERVILNMTSQPHLNPFSSPTKIENNHVVNWS